MSFKKPMNTILAASLAFAAGATHLRAELPMMSDKEWLGYFIGSETKRYQFGMTPDGKCAVKVFDKKGDPLSSKMSILVDFIVEEIAPDGKAKVRAIVPKSLESEHPSVNKINDAVVRGKVTGDATFEALVSEDRGMILLGGRILDPGTVKSPLRFSIRVKFPESYQYDILDDKQKIKAFENKTKNDRIQIIRTDKKRVKPSLFEDVDASSAELNGPGVAALQLEMASFHDKKIEISAGENSSMLLSNPEPRPLYKGFFLTWSADPVKDPEGKSRLMVDVK